MEFRVLGPLEAQDDAARTLDLGPPRQRALLARLLLEPGRALPLDRLLEDLWGEELPPTAAKMVQIYVSRLRKVLPDGMLRTQGRGYLLALDGAELDLDRFEQLRSAGREALARGDPAGAAQRLRAALAIWRGPALAEFDEPFAPAEAARLEELRLGCLEERIEADLARGAHQEVAAELEALTARHPLRERPHGQLMLALYRSGRQADALAVYRRLRAQLDDELGLEPSDALRDLERAILRQDRALVPREAAAPAPVATLPGRADELDALRGALDEAAAGHAVTVFVTGEPGIGKTALADAFLASAVGGLVGRGQCVEHRGPAEPYLPVLDALGDLAAGDGRERVGAVLAERAPSWLAQLPWLAGPQAPASAPSPTAERMLREAIGALEQLARTRPLIVVLEDLQWSDAATLDLVAALARRRLSAPLLVLATFRSTEAEGADAVHLLARDLCAQRLARRIDLGPLDAEALGAGLPGALPSLLHERTAGNPLFARLLVDHWIDEGTLVVEDGAARLIADPERIVTGLPATLRAAILDQLAALDPADGELLRAAAAVGAEFGPGAVAAALERDEADVAARFAELARRGRFLARRDGAFAFTHDVHREVLEELVPAAHAALWHRRVGAWLETVYAGSELAHAAELAHHFVAAGEPGRAVRYLELAAQQALARSAWHERERNLERALEAAALMEPGRERSRRELELLSDLGQARVATRGWSAPEAERTLLRALRLAQDLGDNEPLVTIWLLLGTLYELRGEYARAQRAVDSCLRVAPGGPPRYDLEVHELLACSLFHQGSFSRAIEHAEAGLALVAAGRSGDYASYPGTLGDNAGVSCNDWAALALWYLGRPDQALARGQRALSMADVPARRYSLPAAQAQLSALHQCRDEPIEALAWAEAAIRSAQELGYPYRVAMGRVLRGWAKAKLGDPAAGLPDMTAGLAASRATGARMEDPYYLGLLAEGYLLAGDAGAALAHLDEAFELARRERSIFYEPELHRLHAAALTASGAPAHEATAALEHAVALARRHGSRSLELRALVALARAGDARARSETGAVLEGFAEGFDTPDLRAAADLLAAA